jgi:hypothetical protein
MTAAFLTILSAVGAAGPGEALESFISALGASDSSAAMALLSGEAFESAAEFARRDPGGLSRLAAGLGVALDSASVPSMEPSEILGLLVSSPAVPGLLAMADWSVGQAEISGPRAAVPVTYGLMGGGGTVVVEMVRIPGGWGVADYSGSLSP